MTTCSICFDEQELVPLPCAHSNACRDCLRDVVVERISRGVTTLLCVKDCGVSWCGVVRGRAGVLAATRALDVQIGLR